MADQLAATQAMFYSNAVDAPPVAQPVRRSGSSFSSTAPPPKFGLVKDTALAIHNELRKAHHVSKLDWSEECAAAAQKQADKCQRVRSLHHDNLSGPSGKHGQSLYLSSGDVDVKTAVMAFYSEINAYDYDQPGHGDDTAQFTQLVWKSTRKVGIGISSNGKYLVANYLPAGNLRGSFQQNVLPPDKKRAPIVATDQCQGVDKWADNIDEMSLRYICGMLCCFQGLYCDTPGCLGCSAETMCVCCHYSGNVFCLNPVTCCVMQDRCCCLVQTCAVPVTTLIPCNFGILGWLCYPGCGCCKTIPEVTDMDPGHRVSTPLALAIDPQDVTYCSGMCCCFNGFWCERSECIGCSQERLCACTRCSCDLHFVKPSGCCLCQYQQCCIVNTCAIPCNEEAPNTFGCCGIMCYPVCDCCCKHLGELLSGAYEPIRTNTETEMSTPRQML